jgi:hypothetical protein
MLLAACGAEPAPPPSKAFIETTLATTERLIAAHFPLLEGTELKIQGIDSASVFLATDIVIPSLLTAKRGYILYLNPSLETNPLSGKALTAILVHELTHFNDYQKMNIAELTNFYYKILTSAKFNASYERATDLQTLKLGYADGIKAYRKWLYPQLTTDDLAVKLANYYTPDEIDEWQDSNRNQSPDQARIL